MSRKASASNEYGFPIFVHSAVDDMTQLPPNAMRVYMHLARRADKSGAAWPSYQSIGDHCFTCVSENPSTRKSHARNAIDQLVAAGLVRKEERLRDDGSQGSNGYILVDPCLISTPMLNKHPHANLTDPVLIKHPDAKLADPMLNGHGPCLISTKDSPSEVSPMKERDGSSSFPQNGVSGVWSVCLTELEVSLPSGLFAILGGSRLVQVAAVENERGDLTPCYRVLIVHERAKHGLNHFTTQAGPAIRRKLGSVLGRPVLIEIVAEEQEE